MDEEAGRHPEGLKRRTSAGCYLGGRRDGRGTLPVGCLGRDTANLFDLFCTNLVS